MDWLDRRKQEDDLDRELQAHLDEEAAAGRAAGLSPAEAEAAARRAFGNMGLVKESVRSTWGWTRLEAMLLEFRYAWRGLRKEPGFTLTAILTLAGGIGAATAVFSVVDSVLLKPLAYEQSGRLVAAWEHIAFLGGDPVGPNPRHVNVWSQRTNRFAEWATFRQSVGGAALGAEPPRPMGVVTSTPNLFQVLRTKPSLGRGFLPGEGKGAGPDVAILTHGAWQNLFRGDPEVVGKILRIDDAPRQVIGVLPKGFHFPNANTLRAFRKGQTQAGVHEPEIFIPVLFEYTSMEWNGNYGNWVTLARLDSSTSIGAATAHLNGIQEQILREMPGQRNHPAGTFRASLQPMQEAMVGDSGYGIWLLMFAVAGLLLLACLNLANTQLGRTVASGHEAAVRSALGAARWRLLWSVLAENLLLSGIGGALGVGLAYAGLNVFRAAAPIDLPRLAEVRINPLVILFALALTTTAGVAAGILPAIRAAHTPPHAALQQAGSRTLGSRTGRRVRTVLIALQVFGCTVLLLVTGLFSKSLLHLLHQDRGFETAHSAIAEVRLIPKYFSNAAARAGFIDKTLLALRSSPGVESAAYFSAMPLEGESWIEFARRPDRSAGDAPLVNARWVSPGYFETTRQKLIAGRFFEERDREASSVVISEGTAKALWGTADPAGGQINALGKTFTVIGVVADSRGTSLKAAPPKMIYVHYGYRPPGQTFFLARGPSHNPGALTAVLREAISRQSPHATILRAKTLDAQLTDSLARERFQTFVLTAFGACALLLAMLGIYGVLSYSVAARRQEIGLRMALGATRGTVYRATTRELWAPVALGLAAGLVATLAAVRTVEQFLYGTEPMDIPLIGGVLALFLAAAMLAAFVPARRAASLNPVDALRSE